MAGKSHAMHGRDHGANGADPIPFPTFGVPTVLFDYTITGSDQAAIDSAVDGSYAKAAFDGSYGVLNIWIIAQTDDGGGSGTPNISVTVNDDTGSNYDQQYMYVVETTLQGGTRLGVTDWLFSAHGNYSDTNYPGIIRLSIPGYAQTVFYKIAEALTALTDPTGSWNIASGQAVGYRSTSAISRVKIAGAGAANLRVGSRLLIYGG